MFKKKFKNIYLKKRKKKHKSKEIYICIKILSSLLLFIRQNAVRMRILQAPVFSYANITAAFCYNFLAGYLIYEK